MRRRSVTGVQEELPRLSETSRTKASRIAGQDEIGLARDKKRLGLNLIIYDGGKLNAALGENIIKSRLAWAPRSDVQGRPEDWGRIELNQSRPFRNELRRHGRELDRLAHYYVALQSELAWRRKL